MRDFESKTIVNPQTADAEYIREVAEAKRAMELWTMEPGFREAFLVAPEETLSAHGLSVDALAVKILADHDTALKYQKRPPGELPLAVRRYRAFIREKIAWRERMIKELCVPKHPAFRAWRNRQANRCWSELGSRNRSLIHVPITFELDLGCSVGCPFCGVMAERLQKVCPYDEENAALWKGVLSFAKETVGDAAGQGTCYYATEPLDNPDYEKFTDAFFEVFGLVPQLTTAASMRKPERTRAYLFDALKKDRRVHRFSVLSLDMLHKIYETFTPEELVCVELLPQFTEAPHNLFANAGRAREDDGLRREEGNGSTISCVSGFVVNMAERSIRLITPCGADEAHPTGEMHIAKKFFADLDDFKYVLVSMINRFMQTEIPKNQPLYLRPGISFEKTEKGIEFFRSEKFRLKFFGADDLSPVLYHNVLDKLEIGGKTACDVAGELMEESGAFPANVFFILEKFESAGLFLEPYERDS